MKRACVIFFSILLCFGILIGCSGIGVRLYDGSTYLHTVNVSVGSEYDFGKPEKTGYRFLGWYDSPEGGSALTDSEGKSAGMTWKQDGPSEAYAHWSANTYKILFDYCGATALDDITEVSVVYDAKITERFPVPQKTGFSFAGWFTEKSGGTQISFADGTLTETAEIFTKDSYPFNEKGTTLYAQWGTKKVTYLLSAEGNTVDTVTYPVGTILYEMPAALKDNYCFVSWCFDLTMMLPMEFPYTIGEESDEVITLYAKFENGSNDVLQFSAIAETGDKEYEVSYSGNAERIIVPDSYFGKKVTRIQSIASASVTEIVLPQTITKFSAGAFKNCTALEKINIPSGIAELPDELFSGCENLQAVVLPQGLSSIGKYTFSDCKKVREIMLSGALNSIGEGAFRNMRALERFRFSSESDRYYEADEVLYYKIGTSSSLVQYPAGKTADTVSIPSDVTRVLEYAFSGARLRSIEIGGKITRIGKGAFENCTALITVNISTQAASLTVGDGVFQGCMRLKALRVETSEVPTLGKSVFADTSPTFAVYVPSAQIRRYQTATNWRDISEHIQSLGMIVGDYALEEVDGGYAIRQYFGTEKTVSIPEIINAKRIVEIGENAFSDLELTQITLPASVGRIGNNAFKDSVQLKVIVVSGEPPVLGSGAFSGIADDFGIYIYGSTELLERYKAADGWNIYGDRIWTRNEQ